MKRALSFLLSLSLLGSLLVNTLPARAANANLMANPQVTTVNSSNQPTNWTSDSWGTNNASFKYMTNAGHGDSTSLSVSTTSYTSGDAKWVPDAVTVTPGQNYTYTDWYESTSNTELDTQYTDASGNVTYGYLATLSPSTSWNQDSVSFTIPANVSKVSVLHILYGAGSLQTDDFNLSQTVVSPPPTDGNLLTNSSFETANGTSPASWNQGSWGTNNAQFSYSTNAHTGSRSATVSMTSYNSGDAKWYADPVAVTPGQSYTYSDWYESNATTHVVVGYIDGSGNYTYADLPDAAASSSWKQYSSTFTPPTGTKQVTIFHLLSSVGSLTIDDVDLTTTPSVTPPNGNLVSNNSVETADPNNANVPLDWQNNAWGTNTTAFSYPTTGGHTGSRDVSINMSAYTSGDAKWFFNPVNVTPDTQYKFSDWYEASTATEVDVAFTMSDGSTVYYIVGLPEAATNWTNFTTTFSVPQGAQTMTVYHLIHNVGTLTLDDESLQSYTPTGFNRSLVTLTFDDGYDNEYTQALPILQSDKFISTQFIITDDIGTSGYMTKAQLVKMYQAGNEIASHTVTHDDMLTEPSSQWTTELSQSKSQLQSWTGAPITDMAFPNGLYNQAIVNQTKQYYTGARGVEDGLNSKDNFNAYDIKVQNVYNTTTTAQVTDWVKQAQTTKTWLVLVYHSVNPSTSAGIYNVTPTQLKSQLAAVKSSGVTVETMQQALKEIEAQL